MPAGGLPAGAGGGLGPTEAAGGGTQGAKGIAQPPVAQGNTACVVCGAGGNTKESGGAGRSERCATSDPQWDLISNPGGQPYPNNSLRNFPSGSLTNNSNCSFKPVWIALTLSPVTLDNKLVRGLLGSVKSMAAPLASRGFPCISIDCVLNCTCLKSTPAKKVHKNKKTIT